MKCEELKPLIFSIADLAYVDEIRVTKNFQNPHDHAVYKATEVDAAITELKAKLESVQASAYAESVDAGMENRKLKRALWVARAASAKFWANYWFDVAPSKYIKYDRIGRMEGVEKEFILTKVTKHMTASDWVGLWEKVERLCRNKVEEYK